MRAVLLATLLAAAALLACSPRAAPPKDASSAPMQEPAVETPVPAPLFEGLGSYTRPITTDNPDTQRYFDQGMVLSFGFNHAEAERSFRYAAELDPTCAMCWWGVAYVLGPNINAPMSPDAAVEAWKALGRARDLAENASPIEQGYIAALSARYVEAPTEDRTTLNIAYADSMKALSAEHPEDVDAAVLVAEALMDLHPWDFWDLKTGEPRSWTPEIVSLLESILEKHPDHPMANHLYIHLVEASKEPERALPSAKRLPKLTPGAGHLVHMPAHVYIRVGDYHEASKANQAAVEADQDYITQCRAQGLYPLAYHPHNYHFLSRTASLEGRSRVALDAANRMKAHVPPDAMRQEGLSTLQHYYSTPLYVMTRFGMWDDILQYQEPEADLIYPMGVWHYARGMALTANGDLDQAQAELGKLARIARDERIRDVSVWDINTATSLMLIAEQVLAGEIAAKHGDMGRAIEHLQKAVALEDQQNYDEPPSWYFSTRHVLGALYLQAGQPMSAERVYREDLSVFPNNGWALYGLAQALEVQGKKKEAEEARNRFNTAWSRADVTLTSSRIM